MEQHLLRVVLIFDDERLARALTVDRIER